MGKNTVAHLLVDTLVASGVKRVYGLAGDSLNGITESIRTRNDIQWIPVRHEETAAFAAGADAQLTGRLAVCAGSCGPGNLHLINGLYDCHRSRVPVLAIAAQIPSAELGSNYFQETRPDILFKDCSHSCEAVSTPAQMPRLLEIAIRTAVGRRGVSVLTIPGDLALEDAPAAPPFVLGQQEPVRFPSATELAKAAELLCAKGKRVTILAGAGCAGAHPELLEIATALEAPIVHALRGKEHIEFNNPFDVGMTGLLGFS